MPDNLAQMQAPTDKDAEIKRLSALCSSLEVQRNNASNQGANHQAEKLIAQDDLAIANKEIDSLNAIVENLKEKSKPTKKNSKGDLPPELKADTLQ